MSNLLPCSTKQGLIAHISGITGLTQGDAKIVLEEFLDSIRQVLEQGRTIELRGFGTFYTKQRKARPARNPKTGETVPLPERIVPLFKFSGRLKKEIAAAKMANSPRLQVGLPLSRF
jgi:nucleoid DNA-binding protein